MHSPADCIWLHVLKWLQIDKQIKPWEEEKDWVINKSKGKSEKARALKMCFAMTTYHIWIERNDRVFRGEARTVSNIVHSIKYRILLRAQKNVKLEFFLGTCSNCVFYCFCECNGYMKPFLEEDAHISLALLGSFWDLSSFPVWKHEVFDV